MAYRARLFESADEPETECGEFRESEEALPEGAGVYQIEGARRRSDGAETISREYEYSVCISVRRP